MVKSEKRNNGRSLPKPSYEALTSPVTDVVDNSHIRKRWEDESGDNETDKTAGGVRNSVYEDVVSPMNDPNETTNLMRSTDHLDTTDISSSVSEFPFSTVRVWLSSTLILSIYILVLISASPLIAQYLFHRFLQDHHNLTTNSTNSKKTCSNSTGSDDEFTNNVQREASSTLLYSTITTSIPAFIICLFAGSISDSLGRKFVLFCSVAGALVKNVILCFIIKLELNIYLIYLGAAIDGIVGSFFVSTMAVMATIADITPKAQNKAVRFAILEGIILVCGSLSQLAVGFLIEAVGFFVPVLICACLLFIALLITIFLLPETLRNKQKFTWNIGTHIKKTFGFYFVKGDRKSQRYYFILGLAAHLTLIFVTVGKASIETMFVLNKPICWSSVDIGIFGAVRMVVMSVAAVILLKVCKKRLSLELTGMICGISSAAGFILEGLASSTLLMYLSAVVGLLFTASLPIPRALLSQIASTNEQGALFSSMSCIEAVATLVASTISTLIYNATLDTFRGAVFMVMAGICLLSIVFIGTYRFLRLSNQVHYESVINDSTNIKKGHTSKDYVNSTENARNIIS